MSEGSVEENKPTLSITSVLYTGMDINKIRHSCDSEDVRQGDDNPTQLLADNSSLVQAHTVFDPIFAPIRKLPPEILGKIFIECIPSWVHERPPSFDNGMHPQLIRAQLGRVCQLWNAILNNEPAVWATLALDNRLPALEIFSLWIKRSKSHPLDVSLRTDGWYGYLDTDAKAIVKILRRELWRIRSLFAIDLYEISPLFPQDELTEAPMMQSLTLQGLHILHKSRLARIHCPQLRTLTLWNCGKAVKSLISKPLQNLRVLTIIDCYGDDMLYIKLLQAVPNLVSLTWQQVQLPSHSGIPRVALPSLKSLAFRGRQWNIAAWLLRYFDVPSLEHMEFGGFDHCQFDFHQGGLNMVLDVIRGDGAVQLRRLTLGMDALRGVNFHAMWPHLRHLETLAIKDPASNVSADELFISLSPRDHDFSSVCPQLKTLELSSLEISTGALVEFVQRRVKSDLGDPAPGLVTCLKLSNMWVSKRVDNMWEKERLVDKKVSAQLAKTHGSSVHLA